MNPAITKTNLYPQGPHIINALLSPQIYRSQISRVVVLTRKTDSESVLALKAKGAEVVPSEPNPEHFGGVDVFINVAAVRTPEGAKQMDDYTKAAIDAGIKVFFPSDFGVLAFLSFTRVLVDSLTVACSDHWKYPEDDWIPVYNMKRARADFAEKYGKGKVKVVRVSNGAFLGWGDLNFGVSRDYQTLGTNHSRLGRHSQKAAGFDHLGGKYEIIGDPSKLITFTHLRDVGLSTARLAILSVNQPGSVPSVVRISGDAKSSNEIASLVSGKTGKPIEITTVDPESIGKPSAPQEFVKVIRRVILLMQRPATDRHVLHRLWSGLGRANNSEENSNELVNPGEQYWKWMRVKDWMDERAGNYPMGSA